MRIEFRLSLSWIPLELICRNPNETRSSNRFHGKLLDVDQRPMSDLLFNLFMLFSVGIWNISLLATNPSILSQIFISNALVEWDDCQ